MKDIGKSLHGSLLSPAPPVLHKGKCINCTYPLELYEIDVKGSVKVMRCERCGMLHYYKKDIIGKWRLIRAAKPDLMSR